MNMPTERCSVHNGKLIDMFCKDHDKVCCSACVAIKHRACEHVESLPDIAKGIQDSKVYTDTKTSLQNVLTRMEKERNTRKDKLRNVDQQKDELLEDIDAFETELIRKINELSKTSKEQICSQHQRCKNKIEYNLNVLENVISTATASVQNLLDKNECQLFMNVKTSKELIKDCEALLNDLSAGKTTEEFKFVLNHEIKRNLTSLGFVQSSDEVAQVVKKYDASLYGRFLINPKYCEITGICVMDDGTLVIADNTNSQLKKLNETYAVERRIDVRGKPYSTCKVGPNEVATVLCSQCYNYKVLFVDVGVKMKPGTTFDINGQASSVSYDAKQDALFVCNKNQVSVYTKSGVLLRTYEKNEYDITLFQFATKLSFSASNDVMFVTDRRDKELKALTKHGQAVWIFTDPYLEEPRDVCVLPGDIILLSDYESNNVLQIDSSGKKIGLFLEILRPLALAFNKENYRLIVGNCSNEIQVYSLSRK
ncbi:uncharacterized protein LOC123538638 [Mercenaria mercenaria]|uniref:uncharacterized protein LOC123538638 n=1 Tax=Mercenaria mercenaria TaxID=6596 RepID=UPI00234EA09F|nr:uncharacterized protein LOC123538638 [Mercenaria mercenaria]